MKSIAFLFIAVLAAASSAQAQVELVSGSYFPAELEFSELETLSSQASFDDPARLSGIEKGKLFSDVGFRKYEKRVYSTAGSGSLAIEIVTLLDFRAAYSVMTLLPAGSLQAGPPGDFFSRTDNGLHFAQGKHWIRIQGQGVAEDLPRRVAQSVGNRIGQPKNKPPSLVTHLPQTGLDPASLRYYPGVKAYESFAGSGARRFPPDMDMEVVHAHYDIGQCTGTLYILSFPTGEIAEEYFTGLADAGSSGETAGKTYTKRAGPIVAILEGSFDPGTANKLLSAIKYDYSIKWVYEDKPKVVWGIPTGILGTVVKSLFFVVILFGLSILAGIGVAYFRFLRRARAPKPPPNQPEPDEITRLRLQ